MPGNSAPVEFLVDELLNNGAQAITVDEVMECVGKNLPEQELHNLKETVIRELEYHEMLIPEIPGERYCNAEKLFNGAEFLIVPDGFEI